MLPQLGQQLQAVHLRHLDVEHREVDRPAQQILQRLHRVAVGPDHEALRLERHCDRGEQVLVVVDERDGRRHLDPSSSCGRPEYGLTVAILGRRSGRPRQ